MICQGREIAGLMSRDLYCVITPVTGHRPLRQRAAKGRQRSAARLPSTFPPKGPVAACEFLRERGDSSSASTGGR